MSVGAFRLKINFKPATLVKKSLKLAEAEEKSALRASNLISPGSVHPGSLEGLLLAVVVVPVHRAEGRGQDDAFDGAGDPVNDAPDGATRQHILKVFHKPRKVQYYLNEKLFACLNCYHYNH